MPAAPTVTPVTAELIVNFDIVTALSNEFDAYPSGVLIDSFPAVLIVGLVVTQYESAFIATLADEDVMSIELSV